MYYIKTLCLTSGYVLPNSAKVGEILKYGMISWELITLILGESLVAYPEKEKLYEHNCD